MPILAGGAGIILGPAMFGPTPAGLPPGLASHTAYLSGLLLGIGLAFVATLPDIERHGARFRLLCAFVVLGGFGRLLTLLLGHDEGWTSYAALAMELVVTPALTLWQGRVTAAYGRHTNFPTP